MLRILTSAARSHQLTLVLATHDPELARYADRTVALVDGRVPVPAAPVLRAAVPMRPLTVRSPSPAPPAGHREGLKDYQVFYFRLVRGYRVLDLGRWLLTAAAAAVVAAFLLRALGRALSDPPGSDEAVERLLWCLPPLLAIAWFAAVAARALPAQRAERMAGLTAAGAGPARLRLLIAGEIALACALGALATLLLFLVLRNNIAGPALAPSWAWACRCRPPHRWSCWRCSRW